MRRFRTVALIAAVATVALVAVACGGGGSNNNTTEPPATSAAESPAPAVTPLKVAVIAPSAPNDLAFTQSMVDALNTLKGPESLEIAVSDNQFVVEDAAAAIRNYAQQGYDLVIAHGSQYGGSVEQIAADFPDVSFAWGTAGDTFGLDNVYAYSASSDQGGYVMGTMAAALSTSKVIGVVGPIEVGDAQLYVDGFKAGAEAEDSSVKVHVNYTGSFSDTALAAEAARSFVAANADVMTGTAQMVVGAVGVAKENNVAWFGTQSNQTSLAPEVVVASQVYHWEVVLKQIIDDIRAGKLGGESFDVNLANGGEVIEFNDAYNLPAEVKAKGDETAAGIIDGSITTGVTAG